MLSLCCILVTVASVFAAPKRKTVFGSPAEQCEFPSIVHLQVYDQPIDRMVSLCGGTLIDSTHVLTASHCLEGIIRKVKINIGSLNKWSPSAQATTASRIVKHDGYEHTPFMIKNDIAILTLRKPVRESGCVHFIPMARKGETFGNRRCIAAGWGHFRFKGNSPDKLYKVALPAIPHDVCTRKSRMQIPEGVLCAGEFRKGGASTCQGDSGGPLYCPSSNGRMVLAGVTSFGRNCDMDISAFSDVGYYRDWIESNL